MTASVISLLALLLRRGNIGRPGGRNLPLGQGLPGIDPRPGSTLYDTTTDSLPTLVVLVGVQLPDVSDAEFADSLAELGRLAKTLGHEVRGQVTQRRSAIDHVAFLGPGKLGELKQLIEEGRRAEPERAWLVLLDDEVTPTRTRNVAEATGASVLDRTALILEIFHRHATSRAARAQVEIVRLAYLAPRQREARKGSGERQQGGLRGRGAGEAAGETDRRKVRDRIAELREELAEIDRDRQTQRHRRGDQRRVALVGYTNAGKSTLMRALTSSEVLVADKLFATLDTTVRALQPPVEPRILVSDTVGFIKKLPHGLVASFKSTLDEALEAELLLHLVDISDPAFESQLATTRQVLAEIGAGEVPALLLFNKADRLTDAPALLTRLAARFPEALVVSAKDPADVARIRERLLHFFDGGIEEAEIRIPHAQAALRAQVFASCAVLGERYDEEGGSYRVRGTRAVLERVQGLLQAAATRR